MKGIPKTRGILVVALIVAMVITSGFPVTGTSYAADLSPGSPGAVSLSKTAVNAGINEWDITLTVSGNQQGRSSDIIIVMDRSRSMSYTDDSKKPRIEKAKIAAKDFVSQVLAAGSHTRIAVITFDKTATVVQGLTNSALALNQNIGDINANYSGQPNSAGGTNIQAGLHLAAELMDDSNADQKSVVLIGDGEPTHSYVYTGSVEADLVSCTTEGGGIHKPEWEISNIDSAYDYDGQIVGYGNSYTIITGPAFIVEKACPNDPDNIRHTYFYPENHGIPSVYEADQLGASGVRVYSVGIGVSGNGNTVLQDCVQNGGYLYINTSESTYDFSGIADAISSEAFSSIVTDPIGEMFELVPEITVSTTTPADYNPATRTITWNIGKLYPGDSATMTYRVRAKEGTIFDGGDTNIYPAGGEYPTNGETVINYEYPSGNAFPACFDVPKVPLTGGAVILKAVAVNSEGHLISSSGTEVTNYHDAELLSQGRFPTGENQYMVYGSCQVSMGAILTAGEYQYPYRGYACFNSDGSAGQSSNDPEDFAADVSLTTGSSIQTVYFKYMKEEGPQLLYDVTVRYIDESDQSVIHEDIIEDQPVGRTVTAGAIHFDEYILAEGEHSVKSVTVNAPMLITFLYRHNGEGRYNVTVKYVDGSGTKIHDEGYIYDKEVNAVVSAEAITIANYTLADSETIKYWTVKTPDPSANPPVENSITFVYKAASVNPPGGGGGGGGGAKTTVTSPPALNKTDHFAYVVGYPDGEVKPLGTITREEVAVIFYRLMTEESRKIYASTTQPFTDVNSGRWSNDEIATLYNAKIIQGNSDGSFMPAEPITRAEFAAIAAKFDKLVETQGNKFPDIENHWAKDYINSSAEKGWINGYGDGTFRPDYIIIRCEAMKLINEVLDRRINIAGLHKDTKQWPDNTEDKWYYEIVLEATNTHDYERADKPKSMEKWTKIRNNPVW